MKIFTLLKLLRIHQWLKNLFIFLPLFFDKQLGNLDKLTACFFSFMGFSLVASAIYCLNDIIDIKEDREHPRKKHRPIASREISIFTASLVSTILIIAGFSILYFADLPVSLIVIVAIYLIMNIGYCLILKKVAIIDVIIIGIGFVFRIIVGGLAGEVELSHWIIMMTFLLAIFLGFAKRLNDVQIYTETGVIGRKNVVRYNSIFLNSLLMITATITIVAYLMYTVSPEVTKRFESDYVYITSLFVIIGIFRYLQLSMVDNNSGSPTKILLKDKFLQMSIVCWVLSFILIIYVI